MSVLIKGMEMPKSCYDCDFAYQDQDSEHNVYWTCAAVHKAACMHERRDDCPLIPVPEHGDLIDRDALIKDGWLNLHKEVIRMGGYAIHELPLKNPSIPVIIPADKETEK